jgi:hypothetical protein
MLAEHQFVDAAYTAMRSGRFLLLIAGDGIREDVGAIADLINRNAAAGFAFGLVEVALYGFEDGSLVVQPRVIAKTQIIERTTFSLTHGGRAELVSFDPAPDSTPVADGSGAVRDANNLGESPKQAEYRAWWAPVLNTVFDDPDQEPPKLYWPNNVRAALPWRQTWILAYRLGGAGGVVGVSTAGRGTEYRPMIEALTAQRDEIISELPTGSQYTKFDRGGDFAYRCVRPVSEFTSDDEARDWISRTMNAFVNVFRPRLKSLPLG